MNKSKILIFFSAIISLLMCALTSSFTIFFTYNVNYNLDLFSEIVSEVFNLYSMRFLNNIFVTIFAFNFASMILYLFKTDKMVRIKKIFSLWSILLLIISLLVFCIYTISYLKYFQMNHHFVVMDISFKIMISYWIPKIIVFSILTVYLISVQAIMIKKSKSVRLTKKFIITSIYIASFMFLTLITFFEISPFADYLIGELFRLKTHALTYGRAILGLENANVKYYLLYLLPITLIYSISMLLIRRKSKNKTNIT